MKVTKHITLDFGRNSSEITVLAKQGDKNSRYISVTPVYEGKTWSIPEGTHAFFAMRKPDGKHVYNEQSIEGGDIIIELTDQTLVVAGKSLCTVVLESNAGDILTTQNFILDVEYSPGAYAELESTDEVQSLQKLIAYIEDLLEHGELGGGAPLSDKNPLMNGTASAGVAEEASRADHVHPSDESRIPADIASLTSVRGMANDIVFPLADTTGALRKITWSRFSDEIKKLVSPETAAAITAAFENEVASASYAVSDSRGVYYAFLPEGMKEDGILALQSDITAALLNYLTKEATETYVQEYAQEKGKYLIPQDLAEHNTDNNVHNDIRLLIDGLTARLNALANSDDTTLDQLSEVVDYIKANRGLIESVTTSKVSVSDIIDDLTTNASDRPLSAAQGVALKALIDAITVPTKLSELAGDSTHRTVTDTEKAAWDAKSDFSGKYADLSGKPTIPTVPANVSAFNNDAGYIKGSELDAAVNTALSEAKESGEFDGKDGTKWFAGTTDVSGGGYPVYMISGAGKGDYHLNIISGDVCKAGDQYWEYVCNIKGAKGDPYTLTPADKAEIVEDVLESLDGIPEYWLEDALEPAVPIINTAIETAGRNKSAFLFYTDAHWGYGSGMSPKLLKYLGEHTAINKTIFGGDFGNTYEYPDTGKTMDDWMNVMREWRLAVRDVRNHHSVVGNHDQEVTAISTDKALYGFLFAPEETSDIVRGGDFFYYIDEPSERTRYLYLDTGLCEFSDEQCKFVIEALTSTPAGWHIVAASHIWFVYDSTDTPTAGSVPANIQKLLKLFDDYNVRAKGSMTIETESNAYDFADCGAWVEFCIGGHTHVDYHFTSTNGIPVILCQTDSKHLRGNLYTYTAGTITESSVSAVIADYDNKKISVIRIGRGESFEVEITNYVVSYTNVIPLATTNDGVTIYNKDDTPGYKANTRWSSSSNVDQTSSGIYITGYIPVTAGDVFRMNNVTMPNASGNSCILHLFKTLDDTSEANVDNANLKTNYSPVWGDDGNLIQFTIPTASIYKYIRIQCGGIDASSIITINESIE